MRAIVSLVLLTLVFGAAGQAHEVTLDGGAVDCRWVTEEVLRLEVRLDASSAEEDGLGAGGTWVITNRAHRFADGISSWQLHFSPTHESIVVVPNDFLMVRSLTFEQVGVNVAEHVPGRKLVLEYRSDGDGPVLIRPGDLLEVHALWLKMEPLALLQIPSALSAAGGGGSTELMISASPLPTQSHFELGNTVRHAFRLAGNETKGPEERDVLTCSLVHLRADGSSSVVRHLWLFSNSETGIYELIIDTAGLLPGVYDLYLWIPSTQETLHGELNLTN